MALKKSVATVHGINVEDAYHRVEGLTIPQKGMILFHLRAYADPSKPFFDEQIFHCAYALDGDNPIKQAYAHLKTLQDFSQAQDC